ncbi:MAG: FAD-binding protein, partial [Candidatus Omnitrophica bacterium]|nr:FAD-binding protein [Candidatus Omnitrophota bacterium]
MYDLVIIGAGWAGYNAALKARELNLKVTLVEKTQIGGVCLNLGCIPTKALIHCAKIFSLAKKAKDFGVEVTNPSLNFAKAQERKDKIVEHLRKGMLSTMEGIDFLTAEASLVSPCELRIDGRIIKTKSILLATGSGPQELDDLKFDGRRVLSSNELLSIKEIPSSLLVIGGGAIGCEFANLFAELGSKVTLVEKMPQLIPAEDSEIAKKLEGVLRKKGVDVKTGTDHSEIKKDDYGLILVSVGRSANSKIPGLTALGVKLEKGAILTDGSLKTNIDNIYAAGDCRGGIMLAHFAGYQGKIVVENIVKGKTGIRRIDDLVVPNCIYTDPEIASVGVSQDKAVNSGIDIEVNKFDFQSSGSARILGETQGFLKIISDKKSGVIIGASMIGPKATEVIGILTL